MVIFHSEPLVYQRVPNFINLKFWDGDGWWLLMQLAKNLIIFSKCQVDPTMPQHPKDSKSVLVSSAGHVNQVSWAHINVTTPTRASALAHPAQLARALCRDAPRSKVSSCYLCIYMYCTLWLFNIAMV
jgi:hypothetical protein